MSGKLKIYLGVLFLLVIAITGYLYMPAYENIKVEDLLQKGEVLTKVEHIKFTNPVIKDLVVYSKKTDDKTVEVGIFKYSAWNRKWDKIYSGGSDIKTTVTPIELGPDKMRAILVESGGSGSGGFVEYEIINYKDDKVNTLLSESDCNGVEVNGDTVTSEQHDLSKIYKWEDNKFVLITDKALAKTIHSNEDAVLSYNVVGNSVSVSQDQISLRVGQKLVLERETSGKPVDMMYIGNGAFDFKGRFTIEAIQPGRGTLTLMLAPKEWDTGKEIEIDVLSATSPIPPPKPAKPDLEVLNAEWTISYEYGSKIIRGTVRNNTNMQYKYVQVEINLYDNSDTQVGSTMANVNDLEPHGTWRFEAPVLKYSATKAKLKGVTGF